MAKEGMWRMTLFLGIRPRDRECNVDWPECTSGPLRGSCPHALFIGVEPRELVDRALPNEPVFRMDKEGETLSW